MKQKILMIMTTVGMLMIAAAIVMPIIQGNITNDTFRYIYAAGAAMLLIGRLATSHQDDDMRLRRLYRLETWSAIFFVVAAVFLFYDKNIFRDALAFTLAGGIIQIYTSIMIPIRQNKGEKKKN